MSAKDSIERHGGILVARRDEIGPMSILERFLWSLIWQTQNDDGGCLDTDDQLAEAMEASTATIKLRLASLEREGYIKSKIIAGRRVIKAINPKS